MQVAGTIERAGNYRRAIAGTTLALIVVTALAGLLASRRHQVRLGPMVSPPEWPISFQAPRWARLEFNASAILYENRRDPHNPKQLSLRRMTRPPGWSAAAMAEHVMSSHLRRIEEIHGMGLPADLEIQAAEAPLGPLPGAEVYLPQTGDYVHVALLESEEEPAIVLEYHTGAPFSERDQRLCRMVAASVNLKGTERPRND